jgi:hypothetical protein
MMEDSSPIPKRLREEPFESPGYRPKTELGRKLMALRNQALAKGLTLLDADGIIEEVRRRRGEAAV